MNVGRFDVRLSKPAADYLRGLQPKVKNQIKDHLQGLGTDPRPFGSEKLKGSDHPVFYRIRSGNYRIIYHVDYFESVVNVTKICDRKDAY